MATLHWQTEGEGEQEIVLLHGWGLNAQVWNSIVPRLAPHFRLHRADLPGFGQSQGFGPMPLAEMAAEVLARAPQNAIWLGWSLGGLVASQIALTHPERVTALVSLSSSPCFQAQETWPGIVVKPKSIAGAYQLRAQFRTDTTLAVFPGEVLVKLYGILGDIRLLLDYVAMGTQGLVGIAVAMVAVLHLHQRRRQIGALRAFGAPRSGIFLLVWSGLMLLVSAGILAGVGLGYLAAKTIAVVMSEKSGFVLPVTLGEEDIQFSLLLLVIAAVVLTVPAMLSWRHSPAEALREA